MGRVPLFHIIQDPESNPFLLPKETLQQVKIISINSPLVFLNAKKFHADLIRIIRKEQASHQPLDETSKVGPTAS